MYYLLSRRGRFYFNRRVPNAYREFDQRDRIRVALKTNSRKEALRLALAHNDRLESYWNSLAATGTKHSQSEYVALVDRARLLGFSYYFREILVSQPVQQIVARVNHVEQNNYSEKHVEAVLGRLPEPAIKISDALEKFWSYSKDQLLNKSPNQIRKWENPRKKAIRNLITCIGDKPINQITRDDMLAFKNWWVDRLDKNSMVSGSANKDFIYCKVIITTVAENLKLKIDTAYLFRKLTILVDDSEKRLPLESAFIIYTLLNPETLKGLNKQAQWVLYAFAETGAGLSELTGLLPEDIRLSADIPHIAIVPRAKRALKTKFRKREIPLVGFALDAFNACPDGFNEYRDSPDILSNDLSKFLRDNEILPSEHHSVYSLRHSFQDRLTDVDAPDRVQADLMGHKFNRQEYGKGPTLAKKLEWMHKVQLKAKEP